MAQFTDRPKAPLRPIKWYKKLATRKGRLETGAFLIEGSRAIGQLIDNHPDEVLEIIATEDPPRPLGNHSVRIITQDQFHSISQTKTPQGILAVIRQPLDIYSDRPPQNIGDRILLLEDIQDPGNVGALIRTAAAFNFSGIIMTEKCADPLSPKCTQSTAGSVLSLWIRRTGSYLDLTRRLQAKAYTLIVADVNGTENPGILSARNRQLVLALGSEAFGPSTSLLDAADSRVGIPIDRAKAESLNVAACGAICMYLSSLIS